MRSQSDYAEDLVEEGDERDGLFSFSKFELAENHLIGPQPIVELVPLRSLSFW